MQGASSPGFLMHLFVSMVVATEMTPQRRVRMSCLAEKARNCIEAASRNVGYMEPAPYPYQAPHGRVTAKLSSCSF